MAIPGLRPSFEVRAKVRIGEKRKTRDGKKEFPASVDHFICDDAEFLRLAGEKPKELTILLPFEKPEDNFSTGLESWKGQMLVCYTKGETAAGGETIAYRKATMKTGGRDVNLLDGFTVLGDTMGNDRRPVSCLARSCPVMEKGECKPMGRLQFFVKGSDPSKGVYQLDTKSWNSIEKIEAFLSVLGDPRGRELTLRVEMWARGTSKFPVVTLEGGNVVINDDNDVAIADALVQLHKALALPVDGEGAGAFRVDSIKAALAAALDLTNDGWRDEPAFIARIKEVGVVEASKGLLKRYEL